MSLKAVHLIFVTALSALAFGLGAWQVNEYRQPDGTSGDLLFAIGSFVAGVLVIFYGKYFLKKLRTVSYL